MRSNARKEKELSLELITTLGLCELIDTPRSLAVYILLSNKEYLQYLGLKIDLNDYQDYSSFKDDLLVTKVMSKSPNLETGIDLHEAAVARFHESETQCRETNARFRQMFDNHHPEFFYRMKQTVDRILGPLDKNALNYAHRKMRHGPGATTGVRGRGSICTSKYTSAAHLTANLVTFYRSLLGTTWADSLCYAEIVDGARFTSVLKDSETNRGINIEPTINLYGQLGVGALIRRQLKRSGLDLKRQAETNRGLAKWARRWRLATLDLRMASDTNAKQMLRSLLDQRWSHLIDLFRSPKVLIGEEVCHLEKVSSMGNGFTFELESLIFWSLVKTVVPSGLHHLCSVFGDDIICPQEYAGEVIKALKYLGFIVNDKKSFLDGNFFESCGTDWAYDEPVRPFFLKGSSDSLIPYALQIANKLRTYASLGSSDGTCNSRFRPLWLELVRKIPKSWRNCRVPSFLGDVGLMVSGYEINPEKHFRAPKELSWEGYRVKTMSMNSKCKYDESIGTLLHALSMIGKTEYPTYGFHPVRGYLGKPRPRWTLIQEWPGGFYWSDKLQNP